MIETAASIADPEQLQIGKVQHPVLHVVLISARYPPVFSGAALQTIQVTRELLRQGVRVTVLTAYPGRPPRGLDPIPPGARVVRFATPRAPVGLQVTLGVRAAIWMLLHRDWDLLHLLDFHFYAVLPALLARAFGRPVLTKTTLLASRSARLSLGARLMRAVRSWGYRRSGAVVALSDALAAELEEAGVSAERVLRLPNGVDTGLFRPGTQGERLEARRTFGLPDHATVVASAGMLIPRKDPILLVKAAARMATRPVHVVLAGAAIGETSYDAQLDREIETCPSDVLVHRPGGLPPAQVAELLRAADVFVLASRSEGMPNSLLEGMSAGLPCVATDIPGSRDLLSQGGGRLVAPEDPDAMAGALDAYAQDPGLRARDGEKARAIVEAHYGMGYVAGRYLETYRTLTAHPAREDER